MVIKLEGINVDVNIMGTVRWMGQWFTEESTPANYILLEDNQFSAYLDIKQELKKKKSKKRRKRRF